MSWLKNTLVTSVFPTYTVLKTAYDVGKIYLNGNNLNPNPIPNPNLNHNQNANINPNNNKDKDNEDPDENICKICMENELENIIIPCGHACLCSNCSDILICHHMPITKV